MNPPRLIFLKSGIGKARGTLEENGIVIGHLLYAAGEQFELEVSFADFERAMELLSTTEGIEITRTR